MPDLDVLSSEYTGAGMGGTTATGGTGGTSATGGSTSGNGGTDPTGGTGGSAVGGDTSVGGDAGMGDVGNEGGGAGEAPVLPQCENLKKDGTETDVDCGGKECPKCDAKASCSTNKDCESNFCNAQKRCAEPSCSDGFRNQDETGVDCGGSCAPASPCELDVACGVPEDCRSQFCKDGLCADHCTSGRTEATETDKDCGGPDCGPCADTKACKKASDCVSKNCSNNKCVAATCSDNILNQDESDMDCGGACSAEGKACAVSADCNYPEDCATVVCNSMHQCAADPVVVDPNAVIDDFEDGDFFPNADPGFKGNWYAYGDGSGLTTLNISIIPGQRAASKKALESTGQDFTSWGSGVGVDLNNPTNTQGGKLPWDASAYTGITFWAHAGANLTVTVAMPDIDTEPAGGRCDVANGGCDHHYVKSIQIDNHWRRYVVLFSELVAEPGTVPPPAGFAPDALIGVQFRMGGGQTYDLWIDDLAFVSE